MTKKRLFLSITALIIAVMLTLTSAYAWFVSNMSLNNIVIKTSNVKIESNLQLARDYNRDGFLDLGDDNLPIYEDVSNIIITKILPTQEYHYRVIITNPNLFQGKIGLEFLNISGELANVMSINGESLYGKTQKTISYSEIIEPGSQFTIEIVITYNSLEWLKINSNIGLPVDDVNPFAELKDLNNYMHDSGKKPNFTISNIFIELFAF